MSTQELTIAIPIYAGAVSAHFGHPEHFAFLAVDMKQKTILSVDNRVPPPHEPGVLPRWLRDQGAAVVLAGGIGPRAVQILEQFGMNVITGVPAIPAEDAVRLWLGEGLNAGANSCDHDAPGHTPTCGSH